MKPSICFFLQFFRKICRNDLIVLVVIIVIAFLVRFIDIQNNPLALYGDELTLVYDSYSLLKTGYDQTGQFLPLTFSMRGGTPAGYAYFSIPFVFIFGPTALGVRFLSILAGVGLVVAVYYLSRYWFGRKIGLVSALLLAISPWGISISRGGFETNLGLFLAVAAITFLVYAKNRPKLLIISAIFFGLALHTYQTFRLTLPFVYLLFIITQADIAKYFRKPHIRYTLLSMTIILLFTLTAFYQTLFSGSESRFLSLNMFGQTELRELIIQNINAERNLSRLPMPLVATFHNKAIEYMKVFTQSYLSHYSIDFLFLSGDRNPRHNMAELGGFYLVEMITTLVGLVVLWLKSKRVFLMIMGWILIAPIPSALLLDAHFLRSSFLLPPLIILSGLGLYSIWKVNLYKKLVYPLRLVIVILTLLQAIFFIEETFFLAPFKQHNFWSYSARQVAELIEKQKNSFDYILVSDRIDNIEFAYPVYRKIDPNLVINQNRSRTKLQELSFKKLGNVYIGHIPQSRISSFINDLDGSVIYIGTEDDQKFLEKYQVQYLFDGSSPYLISIKK